MFKMLNETVEFVQDSDFYTFYDGFLAINYINNNMMDEKKLEDFFNRKLNSTTGEAREKVKHAIIARVIEHCVKKAEKKKLNQHYIDTNFGL